jgi:hypothetical protein
MRAVVNIISDRAFLASGWRARVVEIPGKTEAELPEILKAAALNNGQTLYGLIASGDNLKPDFALYVNGFLLTGSSSILKTVKESTQIHVLDCG